MHILKELLSLEIRGWTGEHSTTFCFHCDELKLLRTPQLTEPSWYYLSQSMPAAWVWSTRCRQQPGCWEQHSCIRASCSTDLSNVGEASPWMALLLAALEQQCMVWTYLPCPAQPAVHSSLHQRVFHSSAFPGAAATPLPSTSYWAASEYHPTFLVLSPSITLAITHLTYISAKCLSNSSRLTQWRLYSPMAAVEMTIQHVETGFLCMSCESEHGYQSCQPLQELDAAWGLFT